MSKILFASPVDLESWGRVLDAILEIAKKKTWLREECGWVLTGSLRTLKTLSDGQIYAQSIIDKVNSQSFFKTPEGVALWVLGHKNFPELTMPKDVFRHNDPLHRKEKTNLARILKETAPIERSDREEKHAQTGIWFPKLHFAWDVVLASLLEPGKKQVTFSEFWKETVDGKL